MFICFKNGPRTNHQICCKQCKTQIGEAVNYYRANSIGEYILCETCYLPRGLKEVKS